MVSQLKQDVKRMDSRGLLIGSERAEGGRETLGEVREDQKEEINRKTSPLLTGNEFVDNLFQGGRTWMQGKLSDCTPRTNLRLPDLLNFTNVRQDTNFRVLANGFSTHRSFGSGSPPIQAGLSSG